MCFKALKDIKLFEFSKIQACILSLILGCISTPVFSMQEMTEDEMQESSGQALLNLSYLAPGQTGNFTQDTGFYQLGLDATLDLNLNVKKLQLGCGGVNGATGCDIDIDNLSLSGIAPAVDATGSPDFSSKPRPETDARLTNPFVKLAFKSPDSLVNRELIGFQLGAEQLSGLLTFGNQSAAGGEGPNGINQFSGHLQIASTTGNAVTEVTRLVQTGPINAGGITPRVTGVPINAQACCLFFGGNLGVTSTNYDLLLEQGTAPVSYDALDVTGTRLTEAVITGSGTVESIGLSGKLEAVSLGIINLNKNLAGTIRNLTVDLEATEPLGFIHNINLSDNPGALSFQRESIIWPDAPVNLSGQRVAAQRGWWLGVSGALDVGTLSPTQPVSISDLTIQETLAQTSAYLTANPIDCGAVFAINCLAGETITADVDLSSATPVPFPVSNIELQNQVVTPNCYGGLNFC